MSLIVQDLPKLLSTGSAAFTTPVGLLDDANSVTIFLGSSSGVVSSNCTISVSPIDQALSTAIQTIGASSTSWYVLSSAVFSSGIGAVTISNISFRSLRVNTSANTINAGTIIAYATKQITVALAGALALAPVLASVLH